MPRESKLTNRNYGVNWYKINMKNNYIISTHKKLS